LREFLAILVPFIAIVAIGYAAGRFRLVWQSGLNGLNAYLWYFALPLMLFRGVASRDFAERADPRLAFVHGIATLAFLFVGAGLARGLFGLPRTTALFHGFGSVQANNGFLALPLLPALFGEAAIAPLALTLLADMVALCPLVLALADASARRPGMRVSLARSLARTFYSNPFIPALLLALLFAALRVRPPAPAQTTVDLLAVSAAPTALFALGASLAIYRERSARTPEIALMNTIKLAVLPVVVWALGTWVVPLKPLHLQVGIAVAALPTGVNLFLFAGRYVRDVGVYSTAILTSTVISVFSLTLVVWLVTQGA
jgi:predicted permease